MRSEQRVHEPRGRRVEVLDPAPLREHPVEELQDLLLHRRRGVRLEVGEDRRVADDAVVRSEAVHLQVEVAEARRARRTVEQPLGLRGDSGAVVKLPRRRGREQRVVRNRVGDREGELGAHLPVVERHLAGAGGGGAELGSIQEVRRLQHRLDDQARAGLERIDAGVERRRLIEEPDVRGHLRGR